MDSASLLKQLETQLVAGKKLSEGSENGFRRIGLRVPAIRAMLKQGIRPIADLSRSETLMFWHYAYQNTGLYEVGSLAIYAFQYKSLNRTEFEKVRQWINRCDCWEHSDDLSKIYATVFEEQPDWMMPWLIKWNKDRNPWKRRQSVVSLLEYAQKRREVQSFDTLISFVSPLLSDDEYYVQKGLGWTMREIFNLYPAEVTNFFEQNCLSISPIAWSAATEKLSKSAKQRFNNKRKKNRQRGAAI